VFDFLAGRCTLLQWYSHHPYYLVISYYSIARKEIVHSHLRRQGDIGAVVLVHQRRSAINGAKRSIGTILQPEDAAAQLLINRVQA